MAIQITGAYLSKLFFQVAGQAYTGYLDPTKQNRLFEKAFIQAVERRFLNKQDQKVKDEINNLISINNVLTVINNNSFYGLPLPIVNLTVSTTTWTLTTFLPHNVAVGNTINLSGILGFVTPPNGNQAVLTTPTPTTLTFTATTSTGTYTPNSGVEYLVNGSLQDYFHTLTLKAKFLKTINGLNGVINGLPVITGASNTSPIVVTLFNYNDFRDYEQVTISGITGNTNANGTFYIKKLNDFNFSLYSDSLLQTPVAGNGVYGGIPVLSRVYYNYLRLLNSDEKISSLNKPTEKSPRLEVANGLLVIDPLTFPCQEVTIDYIKKPLSVYTSGFVIDITDSVLNLSLYYNEKLLLSVVDEAVLIFSQEVRDPEMQAAAMEQISDNA